MHPQTSPARVSDTRAATAQVAALVADLFGSKATLTLKRPLIQMVGGDHIAALILSQIIYWSDRTADPDGWFYKTYAEWNDELCVSRAQVDRVMDKLEEYGVVRDVRPVPGRRGSRTAHYRLDRDVLESRIIEHARKNAAAKVERVSQPQTQSEDTEATEDLKCKKSTLRRPRPRCKKPTSQAVRKSHLKLSKTRNSSYIKDASETAAVEHAAAADSITRVPLIEMTRAEREALEPSDLAARALAEHRKEFERVIPAILQNPLNTHPYKVLRLRLLDDLLLLAAARHSGESSGSYPVSDGRSNAAPASRARLRFVK